MASTIPVAIPYSNEGLNEVERAQMLARRYHAEFVDLKNFKIQVELF
jgi:type IV pilus assembly protein PilB